MLKYRLQVIGSIRRPCPDFVGSCLNMWGYDWVAALLRSCLGCKSDIALPLFLPHAHLLR